MCAVCHINHEHNIQYPNGTLPGSTTRTLPTQRMVFINTQTCLLSYDGIIHTSTTVYKGPNIQNTEQNMAVLSQTCYVVPNFSTHPERHEKFLEDLCFCYNWQRPA